MKELETRKDATVLTVLRELRRRLKDCPFDVVDRWDADLCAIGIASPRQAKRLVYVCTFGKAPGRAYADLEFPPRPGDERPYRQGPRHEDLGFDELADLVRRHLRGETRPDGRNSRAVRALTK